MTLPDFQRMPGPSKNVYATGGGLGEGDMPTDVWGTQRVVNDHSLFHGLWTYDIPPSQWFMYENGTQVYTSTNIVSSGGAAQLTADATNTTVIMESRECPRYQPDRGIHFACAVWLPNKTNDGIREWGLFDESDRNGIFFRLKADGLLYAVRRSAGVEVYEQEIDTSGLVNFDVEKNNIYDIRAQWRGAGNYYFYIGDPSKGTIQLVHTISLLGTLTFVSIENPAMPVGFRCKRTTADVVMNIGCCDLTSEGGNIDLHQYRSAYSEGVSVNGTDVPVLVIRNPLQIDSKTNTRNLQLARISVKCAKKATFKFWSTRTLADITGATFKAIGSGSYVEADSPDMDATAVRATAFSTANAQFLVAVPAEAAAWYQVDNPLRERIHFPVVRGDYIVVTVTVASSTADATVEWGEAI